MINKKVLIVSYHFPPREGIASIRIRGIAKYLPKFGWEPTILTAVLPGTVDKKFKVVQTPYPGDTSYLLKKKIHLHPDKGFQEQIGISLSVREGKKSFTSKLINIILCIIAYPDIKKSWFPYAVEIGNNLIRTEQFDAIISSSAPITCHLIAKELKLQHQIPWIADLRDLWTQNHYYSYGIIRKYFERRLEISTFAHANVLTTVSEPLAEDLKSLHPDSKVVEISNGFDPDDIGFAPLTKEFTITYTGELYQGKRDPRPLFKALSNLIGKKLLNLNLFKVRFFGRRQYWLEQYIKEYHLESIVKQYGMVSREFALVKQRESQILLLLNWNSQKERGVYTGKVFEYLAANRPILSIGGYKTEVNNLLNETNVGICPNNLEHIENTILEWYKQYKSFGSVKYSGNREAINKYSHIEMANKFASELNYSLKSR